MGVADVTITNGPILCRSSIIDVITSSAAESEFATAFMNAKEAAYIRNTLQALGYRQDPTPIITDNSFVASVVTGTCKAKRSRAMDMRFYWLKDRVKRKQFQVIWCQGHRNIADHLTKDLPTRNLKAVRNFLVTRTTTSRSVASLPSFNKLGDQCEERGVYSSGTENVP
jgi:hypothetical protein